MADTFEQQLAKALAALGGGVLGKSLGSGGSNVPPQLGQMLDMSLQQQAYQNPLRQAVTQGAYQMLPTFAREGTQLTGGLTNTIPPPGNYGGDSGGINGKGVAAGGALAGLAALMGKNGAGAEGDLSKLFKWIKDKFGHKFQGDKPQAGGVGPNVNPYGDFTGWDNTDNSGMDFSKWDPQPTPDVNTDQFMGQWPETQTPFDPFDPGQLGGGGDFSGSPW